MCAISVASLLLNQYIENKSVTALLFSAGCRLKASCIVFAILSKFNIHSVQAPHASAAHQFLFQSAPFFRLVIAFIHINIAHQTAIILHMFVHASFCLGSLFIALGNICSSIFENLSPNLLLNDF
ncbi:hypothetical protein J5751_06125 [bacterium]|nr:hypothetical protein [bacterium]